MPDQHGGYELKYSDESTVRAAAWKELRELSPGKLCVTGGG